MTEDRLKKTRTERTDKAAFTAILGAILLVVGVCFGTWTYWAYANYRRASDYAERLRLNPSELAGSKYNQDEVIRSSESYAERERHEAILTGAVSLIFLTGAALLIVRAVRIYRRTSRAEYQEIEWRAIEKPAQPIEVVKTRITNVAGIIYIVFVGGLSLLIIIGSIKPDGIRMTGILIAAFNLLGVFLVVSLVAKGTRKSVKSFDASGVTRNDGRHFLWSDFRGVIKRTGTFRFGGTYNWRTELLFDGGVVWVIPQRIKNYAEIYAFVDRLPRAVLKDAA